MFENIKYGSYPQNYDFGDLRIEYELTLFKKLPIDRLTNNIIERLKVNSINWLFDKRIYESNPQNSDFGDLHFDSDERLITSQ